MCDQKKIYKTSFRFCNKISDKAFDIQDNLGKIKRVSIQLLHPTQHMLSNLWDINFFGWATK